MTHLYVILVAGTIVRGSDGPDATALAWAGDTILAIGSDAEVRAISRGDSTLVDVGRATVIPLSEGEASWPTQERLDVGLPASFAVVATDPRTQSAPSELEVRAVVSGGVVVRGSLAGLAATRRHDGGTG